MKILISTDPVGIENDQLNQSCEHTNTLTTRFHILTIVHHENGIFYVFKFLKVICKQVLMTVYHKILTPFTPQEPHDIV